MTHTIFERSGTKGRVLKVKGYGNRVKVLNIWVRSDGLLGTTSVSLRSEDVDSLIDSLMEWRRRHDAMGGRP